MQRSQRRKQQRFDAIAVAVAGLDLCLLNGFDDYARFDFYTEFLGACGWTREDFENEELKRIDREWIGDDNKCLN
jgi:hypothetical protein